MIEVLKGWALGVCFFVVFSSVVYSLVPNDKMKKSVRIICTAVIVFSMAMPFLKLNIKDMNVSDIEDDETYSENQSEIEYFITAEFSNAISKKIDDILSKNGYLNSEINVSAYINEIGSIDIYRVDIATEKGEEVNSKTQEKLYEILGEDTLIVFS